MSDHQQEPVAVAPLDSMRKIQVLLDEANFIWSQMMPDDRSVLNVIHQPNYSIGHCLLWGLHAAEELGQLLEVEKAQALAGQDPVPPL